MKGGVIHSRTPPHVLHFSCHDAQSKGSGRQSVATLAADNHVDAFEVYGDRRLQQLSRPTTTILRWEMHRRRTGEKYSLLMSLKRNDKLSIIVGSEEAAL